MAKQWVDLRLKDMYAIKHSLQNVVRQKEQEVSFLKEHDKNPGAVMKVTQLEEDINHEKWLIQKIVNDIEDFKMEKGIR